MRRGFTWANCLLVLPFKKMCNASDVNHISISSVVALLQESLRAKSKEFDHIMKI